MSEPHFTVLRCPPFRSTKVRRGQPWDGATFVPDPGAGVVNIQPPHVFGPGTPYPVRLNFQQLCRWYWRLDHWQYEWTAKQYAGHSDSEGELGVGEDIYNSTTIPYEEQDGDPTSTPPHPSNLWPTMRQRVQASTYIWPKDWPSDSDGLFHGMITMDFADVLTQRDGEARWFWPRIQWDATGHDSPAYQIESSVQFHHIELDPGSDGSDRLAVYICDLVIDDQAGGVFNVPLYHNYGLDRPTPEDPPGQLYVTTALALKPTAYLT